jgi:hypothetical protein
LPPWPIQSRTWRDTNGNFVPDCDLANPQANGECDVFLNPNFGKTNITTRFDPQLVNGWENRPYNWQLSGTIERELRPGIAVNAGYFRTWYGNFQVTDNLNVSQSGLRPLLHHRAVQPTASRRRQPNLRVVRHQAGGAGTRAQYTMS